MFRIVASRHAGRKSNDGNSPLILTMASRHYNEEMVDKPYPSDAADKFIVRLPPGMRDTIAEAAKANGRSMNAEIIHRLEQSLAGEDGDSISVKSLALLLAKAEASAAMRDLEFAAAIFSHAATAAALLKVIKADPERMVVLLGSKQEVESTKKDAEAALAHAEEVELSTDLDVMFAEAQEAERRRVEAKNALAAQHRQTESRRATKYALEQREQDAANTRLDAAIAPVESTLSRSMRPLSPTHDVAVSAQTEAPSAANLTKKRKNTSAK